MIQFFKMGNFCLTYMKWMNHWHRCDRTSYWSHALIKLIFHFVRADDSPIGSVIEHLSIGFFGTRRGLNLRKKEGKVQINTSTTNDLIRSQMVAKTYSTTTMYHRVIGKLKILKITTPWFIYTGSNKNWQHTAAFFNHDKFLLNLSKYNINSDISS